MNLIQIRQKFAEITGRYDLVNSDYSDNGANFYIQQGQRFLDKRAQNRRSRGSYFFKAVAGVWYIKLSDCRAIEEVYVNSSTERWKLEKKDLSWLRLEFPDLVSSTDQDSPLYYSPAILRGTDITDIAANGSFFNYVLAQAGNEEFSGMVILPAPDVQLVVEVVGLWYEPDLTLGATPDTNESYWTVNYPDILIQAAAYKLEVMYRNTQGAKDWMSAIDLALSDIDKDIVTEEWAGVDQMDG